MIDTRRYQWMVGGLGLVLIVAFSVFLYAHGGSGGPGVPAGQRLHRFVAPLATNDRDPTANVRPVCDPRHPARHGLNICGREATVLAFFAADSKQCIRSVDALQQIAPQLPGTKVAAVAIGAGQTQTLALVREHHWRIPVGYDSSGAVGQLYDVQVCPLIEVARRGGVVAGRLIGDGWIRPGTLATRVRQLLSAG